MTGSPLSQGLLQIFADLKAAGILLPGLALCPGSQSVEARYQQTCPKWNHLNSAGRDADPRRVTFPPMRIVRYGTFVSDESLSMIKPACLEAGLWFRCGRLDMISPAPGLPAEARQKFH
jgi:hypothetical protein